MSSNNKHRTEIAHKFQYYIWPLVIYILGALRVLILISEGTACIHNLTNSNYEKYVGSFAFQSVYFMSTTILFSMQVACFKQL